MRWVVCCSSRLSVSEQTTLIRMVLQSLLCLGSTLILVAHTAPCLALTTTTNNRGRRQVEAAGVDYPTYSEVPPGLSFSCSDKIPGYYADPEAQCQVWHWCVPGGPLYSFLCPNQTLFNQVLRVCDWWFNVECSTSPDYYNINDDLYKIPDDDAPLGRDLLGEESIGEEVVQHQEQNDLQKEQNLQQVKQDLKQEQQQDLQQEQQQDLQQEQQQDLQQEQQQDLQQEQQDIQQEQQQELQLQELQQDPQQQLTEEI
ncbi:hypothetical protein Pmani_000793 [Petrolisthes manimaculis]|uniref:Chitin-binding type-2 domain-containing protein n=1 Tax=Petrolisthes manimaculis TaxID=1843537 RepID=A0AAE1USN0_9EUCA|nr:hypothetical protein Pmani_000793 [Petrolisthes manimaculis]